MRFCTKTEAELFGRLGRFSDCTVIDDGWYKVLSKNGSVMGAFAANLLAKIVFRYRLTTKKDSDGVERKAFYFDGDILQIDYKTLADTFSVSVSSIRSAFDILEGASLVSREFRTVIVRGRKYPNTMFVRLDVERLISISSFVSDETERDVAEGSRGGSLIFDTVSGIFDEGIEERLDTYTNNTNNSGDDIMSVSKPVKTDRTIRQKRGSLKRQVSPSDMSDTFKSQIAYDGLLSAYQKEKELLDYIVLVAVKDCADVCNQLGKDHIAYVLSGILNRADASGIKNFRRYVRQAIINSVTECHLKRLIEGGSSLNAVPCKKSPEMTSARSNRRRMSEGWERTYTAEQFDFIERRLLSC